MEIHFCQIKSSLSVCVSCCPKLEFFYAFHSPPSPRLLVHQDTGTPGLKNTRTQGHKDTRTQGHWDTGTPGHRNTGWGVGSGAHLPQTCCDFFNNKIIHVLQMDSLWYEYKCQGWLLADYWGKLPGFWKNPCHPTHKGLALKINQLIMILAKKIHEESGS